MTRKIHLIVEDPSDVRVVEAIIQRKGLAVQVEHVPLPDGRSGIFALARALKQLIETTLAARQPGECVAVLADAETAKPEAQRSHHKQVETICGDYRADVMLVWAVQEIEAWLLADNGLRRWLDGSDGINADGDPTPKETLQGLLRYHKRLKWQGTDRRIVLQHVDGSGDVHSPSMQRALAHITDSPCPQPETV